MERAIIPYAGRLSNEPLRPKERCWGTPAPRAATRLEGTALRTPFLAAAPAVLLIMAACGSNAADTTSPASAQGATTTTMAPAATTSTMSQVNPGPGAAPGITEMAPAASAPPTAQITSPAVPAQTMTTLPSDSFQVSFQGSTYLCRPHYSDSDNDCARYYGGPAPFIAGMPELYCSYSSAPQCSKLWYPAALKRVDMTTISGRTYVCKPALLGGGLGDKECAPYSGGNPSSVSYFNALKCSPKVGGLQCDDRYYPSEMEGLSETRIGYRDYLCKTSYAGQQCWKWSGYGSPRSGTYGRPDLYCNRSGTCGVDTYPTEY
jgi:hypothetical protein